MIAACKYNLKTLKFEHKIIYFTIGVIRYNSQAAGPYTNIFNPVQKYRICLVHQIDSFEGTLTLY